MDLSTATLKTLKDTENLKFLYNIYNNTIKKQGTPCNKELNFETTENYISVKRICTATKLDWIAILYVPKWQVVGEVIVALIVSLIVTVSVVVIGIISGVIIAFKLPLQKFIEAIKSVSNMELDNINLDKSYFYELSVIQSSFLNMVNRIKLYRAFIPTFLLSELEDNIKNDKQFDEKKLSNDDNKKKNNIVVPFNSSIMQKFELERMSQF